MQVSLNDLVMMLAARTGKPFDVPLQEQLKVIINYKRADWFQKVIDKHPEQRKYFLKDFSAELMEVDKAECPVETDCMILRTVEKIPVPVRSSYGLFDYVGDPDKEEAYRYLTPDQAKVMNKYNKYTANKSSYFYSNGYVYLYNQDSLEYVNIRGIFSDPRELHDFVCDGAACYTDDDKYDLPEDIVNLMIQDTLKNELRNIIPIEQGEVEETSTK